MQILSVLAGLAAISSAATIPRTTSPPSWNITNFSISGERFGILTFYEFDITDGNLSTSCHYAGSTEPEIGYVPFTNCTDPTYAFSFGGSPEVSGEDGFDLEIWENTCGDSCVYVGVQFFPESDVMTVIDEDDPNGDYDYLDAPSSFVLVADGTHV